MNDDSRVELSRNRVITIKNFNMTFNFLTVLLNLSVLVIINLCLRLGINGEVQGKTSLTNVKFLKLAIKIAYSSFFLSGSLGVFIRYFNKTYYTLIAILNNVLFSISFKILAGFFRSYLFTTSDPLLLVVSIEIIFRYMIVTYFYQSYFITKISASIILIYVSVSIFLVHEEVPSSAIFFILLKAVMLLLLTLYSKAIERQQLAESRLKDAYKSERNYYYNILDKLGIGVVVLKKDYQYFLNQNIEAMIEKYAEKHLTEMKVRKENSSNEIQYHEISKDEYNGLSSSTSFNFTQKIQNSLEFFYGCYEKPSQQFVPIRKSSELESFDSKSKQEIVSRFMEILFKNLTSYNSLLPGECISAFKLHSDNFCSLITVLEKYKMFNDFIKIGTVSLTSEEGKNKKYYELSIRVPMKEDSDDMVECIFYDITNLIKAENQKNEFKFKSILLAKIAHEFKNPINTISALCTNINKNLNSETELHASLRNRSFSNENSNFIVSLCDYLLILIEDLNTFIKIDSKKNDEAEDEENQIETIKYNLIDITNLLDFCFNIFKIRQNYDNCKPTLTIQKAFDTNIPKFIISNETKLKQVIINLMSNAYKVTSSGSVTLEAKMVYELGKTYLEISINDTGVGLSKDDIQSLFKPIHSSSGEKYHGSGLGLIIIQEILHELNSQLNIISTLGTGSEFSFRLQLESESSPISAKKVYGNCANQANSQSGSDEPKGRGNIFYDKYNIDDKENELHLAKVVALNSSSNEHEKVEESLKRKSSKPISDDSIFIPEEDFFSNISNTTEKKSSEPFILSDALRKTIKNHNIKFTATATKPIVDRYYRTYHMTSSGMEFQVCESQSHFPSLEEPAENNHSPSPIERTIGAKIKSSSLSIVMGLNAANNLANAWVKYRVLICDDEKIIAESIKVMVTRVAKSKKIKIGIEIVNNGIECLYKIYSDFINGTRYDLLLIDENMPFMLGSDCIRILCKLKSERKINDINIYSITSYMDPNHMNYIKQSGANEIYNKPISINMMENIFKDSGFN